LVQAFAGSLDSSGNLTQESSRRRHLAPRYVFYSFAWLLGVAVTLALGLHSAWKQPKLYLVAAGTIAAIILIEYIRSIRFKSVIMVAEFAHFGSPAAAEESAAFRARVMEELARAVKSRHGRGTFQVRKLRFRADASDSDDRRRALALARSSRCAVVIAGSVR